MNDTDFQTRLKTLVNAQVDARVGLPRTAPAFLLTAAPRMHRRLAPLLAAACVALLAGGVVVGAHFAGGRDKPAPPGSVSSPPASSPHSVELGGASIALPTGWSAITDGTNRWCLTPRVPAVGQQIGPCHLTLTRIAPSGPDIDVDAQSGYVSDPPQYCAPHVPRTPVEATDERTFGGRTAQWRHWEIPCDGGGTSRQIEQYVVATGPGFILYSDSADATVHAAMTEIANNSTLPPQTDPLRYMDRGVLANVTQTASGVRILVRRTIRTTGDVAPGDGAGTYTTAGTNTTSGVIDYLVPKAVFARADSPSVGTQIYLATNGRTVREIDSEG